MMLIRVASAGSVLLLSCLLATYANAQRPNIMIIMADDLGFSDLGCYGGEIETPNLDALAANGLRFTRFYNTGRCWPTRASLLTGFYAQQVRRDKLPGVEPSGIGGKRPVWAPLVPVYFSKAGYRSFHTGKWHLDSKPIKAGFDQSYFLGDQARFFSPKIRFRNDVTLPAIKRGTDYYATTDLATETIGMLRNHFSENDSFPFFHYIALTAPHFPLHALPEDIDKYRKVYQDGWDKLRQQRWERIKQLGIFEPGTVRLSAVEPETGAPYERPADIRAFGPGELPLPKAWDSLTEKQKEFQATKMAIHAAMVDRIDQELGRVFQFLRDNDQFDNTLIIFLSDNGASSELMIRDDGHDPQATPGSADTHLCLGPGWATVCNTPFRKHKTWVHEGGIATPMIAHWPSGIRSAGTFVRTPGHVVDCVPTILELAGITEKQTQQINGQVEFPGTSLVPLFRGREIAQRPYLWWCHDKHQAIQVGSHKLVRTAGSQWELYDLSEDRSETRSLSPLDSKNAVLFQQLKQRWSKVRDEFIRDAKRN